MRLLRSVFTCLVCALFAAPSALAQQAGKPAHVEDADADDPSARAAWFRQGRTTAAGDEPAAALLHRAQEAKRQARARARISAAAAQPASSSSLISPLQVSSAAVHPLANTGGIQWTPLGPGHIQSDSSENYGAVTGRVTAIAIDPADATGNTVFIGSGGGGVWKSTNAAQAAANVTWKPLSEDQPSLVIGALAIRPGSMDCSSASPTNCVLLAGTGETDNSGDSYYGLGILRSTDGGTTWQLISETADKKKSFHGIGFSAIAFSTDNPNLVVAAGAAAPEAIDVGAEFAASTRGLYYSTDAGASWTYAQFSDNGVTPDAQSITSAVYDAINKTFYAAYRFHGLYSSSDGQHWSRLANQPGAQLSAANCPATQSSNCPMYRGQLAVQPQTGDVFVWYVDINAADQGIYRSTDGGNTWSSIHQLGDGITNCGGFANEVNGCGTDQATFNMELLAVPNGSGTDVYAGAVNVFKCSITASNPACQNAGSWLNLSHAYGCSPSPGVFQPNSHPDQHAIAAVPGRTILYFGNDGGVYRSLNAPGLQGACGAPFDNLNSSLGSLTQLISFSHDPNSSTTVQAGTQDNGTAATNDLSAWSTIGTGDGGYNEIDPSNTLNWTNSGNYVDIAYCGFGSNCARSDFSQIVASGNVGNDAAPFYVRYLLDPTTPSHLILGTCRLWRGSATSAWGNTGVLISPNFWQGKNTQCLASDDMIRAIAAGGSPTGIPSAVIYVGTKTGLVAVGRNPTASSGWTPATPLPGSSCPGLGNRGYPISDIVLDPNDATGATAYLTVMGFGVPHVFRTANFGGCWIALDPNNMTLPDAPANAIVIDQTSKAIYVGTDVGVFVSTDGGQSWVEHGIGLPNVPVMHLRIFNGTRVLRAATYGRGLWQAPLAGSVPDFTLALSTTSAQQYPIPNAQTVMIAGTITPSGGFAQQVTVSCDTSALNPSTRVQCTPTVVGTASGAQNFSITAANDGTPGDYTIAVLASDGSISRSAAFTLHVSDFSLSLASASITAPHSATQTLTAMVSPLGSYSGTVAITCSGVPVGMTCSAQPSALSLPAMTSTSLTITAASSVPPGAYPLTITATATDGHASTAPPLTVNVTANSTFVLSAPTGNLGRVKVGQPLNTTLSIASQDGYSGAVNLSCSQVGASSLALGACSISPSSVILAANSAPQNINVTISTAAAGAQNVTAMITATDGAATTQTPLAYAVTDFMLQVASSAAFLTNSTAQVPITISPLAGYTGTVALTCDASTIANTACTLSPAGPYAVNGGPITVTANIPLSGIAAGDYSLKLSASDAAFAQLAHAATQNIAVQDFSLIAQVDKLTVKAGQAASTVISVAAQNGFGGSVSFSCSGLPSGALCVFTPNVLASVAGGATTTLTLSTSAGSSAGEQQRWLDLECVAGGRNRKPGGNATEKE